MGYATVTCVACKKLIREGSCRGPNAHRIEVCSDCDIPATCDCIATHHQAMMHVHSVRGLLEANNMQVDHISLSVCPRAFAKMATESEMTKRYGTVPKTGYDSLVFADFMTVSCNQGVHNILPTSNLKD